MAALLASAPATATTVAPPLNVPVRQTIEQLRIDGTTRRTFTVTRLLTFVAEESGFRLTATLQSAEAATNDDGERARYRAANAPLIKRPIVMHLDHAGTLLAINDEAAVWRDWIAGVSTTAPPGRDAGADVMRQRLDALSAGQRRSMIASIAEGLFAKPAERVPAPPRPITLNSPPPFVGLVLSGTVQTLASGDRVDVRTAAAGRTAASAATPAASIAITIDRSIDPSAGLVVAETKRETVSVSGGKLTTVTTTKLQW